MIQHSSPREELSALTAPDTEASNHGFPSRRTLLMIKDMFSGLKYDRPLYHSPSLRVWIENCDTRGFRGVIKKSCMFPTGASHTTKYLSLFHRVVLQIPKPIDGSSEYSAVTLVFKWNTQRTGLFFPGNSMKMVTMLLLCCNQASILLVLSSELISNPAPGEFTPNTLAF